MNVPRCFHKFAYWVWLKMWESAANFGRGGVESAAEIWYNMGRYEKNCFYIERGWVEFCRGGWICRGGEGFADCAFE